MAFPREIGLRHELEQLRREFRALQRAQNAGLTSIAPDEGSTDVVDAEGVQVARVGHDETGTAGLLVPDGSGGWVTVQEDAQARADEALSEAEGQIGALDTRMGAAEGRLDSHASRIGAVENRATTAEGRLDSHASRLGSAEGRLDSHAARIGAVEGMFAQFVTYINTVVVPAVNDLRDRVSDLEGGSGGGGVPPWA